MKLSILISAFFATAFLAFAGQNPVTQNPYTTNSPAALTAQYANTVTNGGNANLNQVTATNLLTQDQLAAFVATNFFISIFGKNSVSINGTITNFASSQTAGIQEAFNYWQSKFANTNYGPTISGVEFDFPAQYTYITNNILFSNNYPYVVTLKGVDQASSKLVFCGTNQGVSWFRITSRNNTPYALGTHVFVKDLGWTELLNGTNFALEIDNYAWLAMNNNVFESWNCMTNQLYGADLSLPSTSVASMKQGLAGLKLNAFGDHLTDLGNIHFAGVGFGCMARCDHLVCNTFKTSLLGYYSLNGGNTTFYGNAWPSNTLYGLPIGIVLNGTYPALINHFDAYDCGVAAFLQNCVAGQVVIHCYEKDGLSMANFLSDNGVMPLLENTLNDTQGAPITTYLVDANYLATNSVNNLCVQMDTSNRFSISSGSTKNVFSVGVDGSVLFNGAGVTNLTAPYLSYSNSLATNFIMGFTTSNTVSYSTNNNLNTITVSGGGLSAGAGGTYKVSSTINYLDVKNGTTPCWPYSVWTNTASATWTIVLNDPWLFDPMNPNSFSSQSLYSIESNSIVYYDNGASSLLTVDGLAVGWEGSGSGNGELGSGTPVVAWTSSVISTNYVNRVFPTGALRDGSGLTNIPASSIVASSTVRTINSVAIGTSPFSWTNKTGVTLECYFSGSVAYAVSKNGATVFGSLASDGYFALQPTNYVTITYTVAPTFYTNSF